MVNLLGDLWFRAPDTATPCEPDWTRVLAHPQAKLHLYGKSEPRRGRKMGHVTCLAPTLPEAIEVATTIRRDLGIPADDGI
jgi:5-(carboxyamino)imidazole ribonucleotide synthase